jgi:PAS domain S-box-containing protein
LATAEAGLGKDFLPMVERLKNGKMIYCVKKAQMQQGIVVTKDPPSTCTDCPLAKRYPGRAGFTARLEHDGKMYGLLTVSITGDFTADEEEQSLFEEVADDIAFALHVIEVEEERKQAEKELLFKEDIIRSSSSVIGTCDLEGNMTFGNPAFLTKWGFDDAKEFLGKPFTEYWVVKDRLDEIMQALLQGEGRWFGEIKARRKDGTLFDVQISAATVYDTEGNPIALTSTSTDITDRKRAEEELAKHRNHLEEMVRKRTDELQKMVNLMAGREVRMAELKETIKKLRTQLEEAGMTPVADDPLKEMGRVEREE